MKFKIDKIGVKYFISLNWWKIIFIFLIGILVSVYIGETKTKYKDSEIAELLVTAKSNKAGFEEELSKKFDSSDGISAIQLISIESSDSNYSSLLKTRLGISLDVYTMESSLLNKTEEMKTYAYKFTTAEKDELLLKYNLESLEYSGALIGFKIFDKNNETYNSKYHFTDRYTFSDTSYVFIDKTSTNLSTKSNNGHTVAYNVFSYFIDLCL